MLNKPLTPAELQALISKIFLGKIGVPEADSTLFVQKSPLTLDALQTLDNMMETGSGNIDEIPGINTGSLGSASGFHGTLKRIEDEYISSVSKNTNLTKIEQTHIPYASNMNLNLITKEEGGLIHTAYRNDFMQLERIFQKLGVPSISLPSDNMYSHQLRYLLDPRAGVKIGESIHPIMAALMMTTFNISKNANTMADIKTGKNRLMYSSAIKNFTERSALFYPNGVAGEMNHLGLDFTGSKSSNRYTVYSFDEETTGLIPGSQVRSTSIVGREIYLGADGKMESSTPKLIRTSHAGSDMMDLAGRLHLANDGTVSIQPLSELTFISEMGKSLQDRRFRKIQKSI